ncbi:hypothetical protein PC114_g6369 [Phytophthora cactorum]|nr:hypothetical protein PC114_g6369 [Phytophthora cactorum]
MRSGKRTRYDWIYREFLVHWRGYEDPSWVDEADLNCGALLHEFLRECANHNRFDAMQSHEEQIRLGSTGIRDRRLRSKAVGESVEQSDTGYATVWLDRGMD